MSGPRELLTFRKMAGRLGWGDTRAAATRLDRAVRAREQETGRRIATRTPGGHRRITETSLSRWLPELRRSKVDELMVNFRAYLSDIDDRISEGAAAYISANVDPRLDELWERDENIAKSVDALGKRVAQIVSQKPHELTRKRTG